MRPETARSRRDRLVAAAMTWAASGPPLGGAGTRLFRSVWLGGKKAPDGYRTRTSSSPVVAPVEAAAVPVAVSRGAVTQVRGHVGRFAAESESRRGEGRRQRRSGTRGRRAGFIRVALTHSAPRTDWETARKARVRAPREAFAAGVRFGTCAGHSPAGTAAAAGRGRQGIVVVSPVAGHDDGASKSCAVVSPLECGMPYGACGRVT